METNNITAALGLASFDANDNQFHTDNLSLAGLPYVQDSGLYRATIVTARLETRTVQGTDVPVVSLGMRAQHYYNQEHLGRLYLTVFMTQRNRAAVDNKWRELLEACGALVPTPDNKLVPQLEVREVPLEAPDAQGRTTAKYISTFEGKEIALVITRGKLNQNTGRHYLNACVFLNKDLFHYTEVYAHVTEPKLVFSSFSTRGMGLDLDYGDQGTGGTGGTGAQGSGYGAYQAPATQAAPAYPTYPAYAGIPQPTAQGYGQQAQQAQQVQAVPPAAPAPQYAPQPAPQGAYNAWGQAQGLQQPQAAPQSAPQAAPVPAQTMVSPYAQMSAAQPYGTQAAQAQGAQAAQAQGAQAAQAQDNDEDIPF